MMSKRSPVAIFLAASTLMASAAISTNNVSAGESKYGGGLKEWNTDQGVKEKSTLDKDAKKAKKKAIDDNVCIPIGEGENCW